MGQRDFRARRRSRTTTMRGGFYRKMNETPPSLPTQGTQSPPALAEPPPPAPTRRVLTPRNYAWIVGAAIVVFLGLRYLGPVLTPFLIGAILAYLGTPIV